MKLKKHFNNECEAFYVKLFRLEVKNISNFCSYKLLFYWFHSHGVKKQRKPISKEFLKKLMTIPFVAEKLTLHSFIKLRELRKIILYFMYFDEKTINLRIAFYCMCHKKLVYLFANDLGQEILLDVTNPTIVSYIKIVGFGTG